MNEIFLDSDFKYHRKCVGFSNKPLAFGRSIDVNRC